MVSILKATAIALAGLALVPATSRAQSDSAGGAASAPATTGSGAATEFRLNPVVVTATRSERTLVDQPMSVTVVDKKEIEQTPAQSLDDVIRTVPGVNLPLTASYQVHPTANFISMRGLGGGHHIVRALVLLDGIPINDPFFGYVQWNRVPMDNIERVEIVRGAGASMWGNYAMGGVINIVTRTPGKQQVGASGGGGSYGTYRGDGFADLVLSESVKMRANFDAWGTSGFNQIQPAYGPIYTPTSFNALNGQATLYFNPDPTFSANFRANVHSNNQVLMIPVQANNQQIYDIGGTMTKKFDVVDVTMTAFHEQSRFMTNNAATPAGFATGQAAFLQNQHTTPVFSTGGSVQASTRVNDLVRLVSVGADFQWISGMDSALIYNQAGAVTQNYFGGGKQQFVGAFAQVDMFPVENFEVLLSGRLQTYLNYDGFDGAPGGAGNVSAASTTSFDPRLSVQWTVTPNVGLRAAGYSAFRAPTLDNLYRSFSVPFGIFLPNAQLSPEKLWGFEAGFDLRWGPVTGQFTGYYQQVTDLITTRNLTGAQLPAGYFFGTQNINAGKAIVQGLEAQLGWQIAPGWKADVNYTTVSSKIVENQYDALSIGRQQAGIPTQQAAATLGYSDPRGWRAMARFRWIGQSWGDNDNTLPLNSFTVFDLSGSYTFENKAEAFVQVQNLFNQYYIADNSGLNPPLQGTPFTIFAGVKARF
ncbi:MAG: TonB-dependent receptor [Proteobacteria bacterium]|nr:TonB-dependent receptor [Pseudomonadota bacterium]